MTGDRPVVVFRPHPVQRERIFTAAAWQRLQDSYRVVDLSRDDSEEAFAAALPEAFAVVGQPALDAAAIDRATELRCVMNVEGNFFPNVDYGTAFARGVRVLGCGTAYSQAVAEYSLALALDAARGITREDRNTRAGSDSIVSATTADSILLRRATVGLIGYGNLGRSLHALLAPFHNQVRVYDPWLPASIIDDAGATSSSLQDTLSESTFVFVFATATAESQHLLDGEKLDLLAEGARLILVSRAAVVDYDALLERLRVNRFHAAIDVWPTEPIPADSEFLALPNVIVSAHRAGGIPEAFHSIGEMVCDDLELMANGLPPVQLQSAAPELVTRYRNKPVG